MATPPLPDQTPDPQSPPLVDPITGLPLAEPAHAAEPVEPSGSAPVAGPRARSLSRRAIVAGGVGGVAALALTTRQIAVRQAADSSVPATASTPAVGASPSARAGRGTTSPSTAPASTPSAAPSATTSYASPSSRATLEPVRPSDSAVASSGGIAGKVPLTSLLPVASSRIADIVGVTAVTSTNQGIWGEDAQIATRLAELRIKRIRTGLFQNNSDQWARMRRLAAQGIRFETIMGDPTNAPGTPEQLVGIVATQLPGAVISMEGANEWNMTGRPAWATELRTHQRRLYAAAKANSRTRSIPVVGPSLGLRGGYSDIANLGSAMDIGNIHLYQGGFPPGYRSDDQLALERTVCGVGKPIFVTETGWHNAIHANVGHKWTSEWAAGVYAPRVILDYFQRGVPRVFFHELLDEPVDPSMTNPEAHFGLLRGDFSRKPAYSSLRNLMMLLDAPGTATKLPLRPLGHTLRQTTSDLRSVTAARNDGSYVVFLWRDVAIWDVNRKVMLDVPSKTVSLGFVSKTNVQVYRPSFDHRLQGSTTGARGTEISLGGEVAALVVRPV